jgi:energy-coupling factor transport system permease protein
MDSTLYRPGNSFFHRRDSRLKLFLLVEFGALSFLFYNPLLPLLLALTALFLNCVSTGIYTFKNLFFRIVLVMMIFLVILHGFANPAGKTPALFFGHPLTLPYFGSYTLEGFYIAMVFWLRMACVTLAALLYVSTTTQAALVSGLQRTGLPFSFCFMLSLSLSIIPTGAREARIIHSAQCARGLTHRKGLLKIRGLPSLFVPLVVSSLDRMETLSMALESRAYGSIKQPTTLYDTTAGKGDTILLALLLAALLGATADRLRFGSLNWIDRLDSWGHVFIPPIIRNVLWPKP